MLHVIATPSIEEAASEPSRASSRRCEPGRRSGSRGMTFVAALLVSALAGAYVPAKEPAFEAASAALKWRLVGPFRGGRTRAVAGVPGQLDTFYVGAVNGGIWKTTDSGRTWNPIFDAAPTQSIGAIAVAPSNPSILYAASGEGLMRPDLSVGDGLYRSADAGRHWEHVGLEDAQQIPDLAVDPKDPNRVFAAVLGHPFGPSAQRGVFRSLDGGKHWTRTLYLDDDTGASFVRIDPSDSNVLYAGLWNVRAGPWEDNNVFNGTAGGLFKSVDGGEHWQHLQTGLPENLSQIDVTIAPSDSHRLYATIATNDDGDYASAAGLGVFRSDDAGEHWRRITDDPKPALRIGGGDLPLLKVDPRNPDVLYSATLVVQKSTDGGVHWHSLHGSPGGDDYQNIWISPDDPQRIAIVADQGAIITVNGGQTWSSWLNQPTAQLYYLGISNDYPYRDLFGPAGERLGLYLLTRQRWTHKPCETGTRWASSSTAMQYPIRWTQTSSMGQVATSSLAHISARGRRKTSLRFPSRKKTRALTVPNRCFSAARCAPHVLRSQSAV